MLEAACQPVNITIPTNTNRVIFNINAFQSFIVYPQNFTLHFVGKAQLVITIPINNFKLSTMDTWL